MGARAEVEFEKVCPACDAGCRYLELKRCDAFAGNILFDRYWYCINRDMCKRLWERMEAAQNERPDRP